MQKKLQTIKLPIAPTKERIINKLFLIGNGFDLSLGLKTRYEDFLLWYFKRFITVCLIEKKQVRNSDGYLKYFFNSDELFTFYNESNYMFNSMQLDAFRQIATYEDIQIFIDNNKYKFSKKFNSELFESIYQSSLNGWVDIEKAYFILLKKQLKIKGREIEKLNADLNHIKNLIKEYLETLDYSVSENSQITNAYLQQFISDIKPSDVIDQSQDLRMNNKQILFLNFNYTPSLFNILKFAPTLYKNVIKEKCQFNYIHGTIHDQDNDLIFGYGDEMDSSYKEIEDMEDNRFLENFKSFRYNHNSNYRDLLRFVNSNDYQVCIYGHSCGLSDRVMLNEIFEHDNCKSIKIYYYNKEEFVAKNMEISRHFNSNKLMRQRIVEFNLYDQIPQIKN